MHPLPLTLDCLETWTREAVTFIAQLGTLDAVTPQLGNGTRLESIATIRARHVRRILAPLGETLPPKAEGLLTMYVNDEVSWAEMLDVKTWLMLTEGMEERHHEDGYCNATN